MLCNFYPRSPRGERPFLFGSLLGHKAISIHAPREGSDVLIFFVFFAVLVFLSTLPARGATRVSPNSGVHPRISIHAPREGSDGK